MEGGFVIYASGDGLTWAAVMLMSVHRAGVRQGLSSEG